MVKMCESGDLDLLNQKDKEEIKKVEVLQQESDSLLTEMLHDIDTKQHQYNFELDSLQQAVSNDSLTDEEILKLEKKIGIRRECLERLTEKALM